MPIDDRVPRIPEEDMGEIICDNWNCDYVSDYGRCYMHIYVKCPIYIEWKSLNKRKDNYNHGIK